MAVVRFDPHEGARRLDLLTWGLLPSWADDPGIGERLVNTGPRPLPRSRRSGTRSEPGGAWWLRTGSTSGGGPRTAGSAYFVHMRDDRPFAFAGLWEHWEKGEEPIYSCTLLTTAANEVLAPIHDRMPVIVPRSAYDLWLDPAVHEPKLLEPLLVPFPPGEMEYRVGRHVNDPE